MQRFRQDWPAGWPGLPLIVSECLAALGCRPERALPPPMQALHACLAATAEAIEQNGRERCALGTEPAYHNRLHIADTLVALVCLLLHSRTADAGAGERATPEPSHREWLLLLAMLAHDYLHTGRVNQFPAELEQASVDGLRPLMQSCGLDEADQTLVGELILMTDPTRVGKTHQALDERPFSLDEFNAMAALLQESDILASVLPGIGIEQTRRLADEWSAFSAAMATGLLKASARITFLRDYARFSSPASRQLGIPALVDQQLAALAECAPDAPI